MPDEEVDFDRENCDLMTEELASQIEELQDSWAKLLDIANRFEGII